MVTGILMGKGADDEHRFQSLRLLDSKEWDFCRALLEHEDIIMLLLLKYLLGSLYVFLSVSLPPWQVVL